MKLGEHEGQEAPRAPDVAAEYDSSDALLHIPLHPRPGPESFLDGLGEQVLLSWQALWGDSSCVRLQPDHADSWAAERPERSPTPFL